MRDYPESRYPGKAKQKRSKLPGSPKSIRRGEPGWRDDGDNNDPGLSSGEPRPIKGPSPARTSQKKIQSLQEKQEALLTKKAKLETKLKSGSPGELVQVDIHPLDHIGNR